ncbi:hypothetical protein CALCODRAFT_508248 [Calocera cornea HHB12733]|uniref:Uncharacterized protein n=1 Tax=Calocera cornea HHB12733 TaxID=1353952 RepID=A0A165GLH2_9BASI|nr:hypothetical protein CALCODRAFT_508248 [Calocera cornea HHB12733]
MSTSDDEDDAHAQSDPESPPAAQPPPLPHTPQGRPVPFDYEHPGRPAPGSMSSSPIQDLRTPSGFGGTPSTVGTPMACRAGRLDPQEEDQFGTPGADADLQSIPHSLEPVLLWITAWTCKRTLCTSMMISQVLNSLVREAPLL